MQRKRRLGDGNGWLFSKPEAAQTITNFRTEREKTSAPKQPIVVSRSEYECRRFYAKRGTRRS